MRFILCLLMMLLSWGAKAADERSLFDIEHELKQIILGDFSESEAVARRQSIQQQLIHGRHRTQFLYELSACGVESSRASQEWVKRSSDYILKAQKMGSKELEMYARYCRSFSHSIHGDVDKMLEESHLISQWSEQNLTAYRHLAFANRVRLLSYAKSNIYTAADAYRDLIVAQKFALNSDQLAETKVALADLFIQLRDFQLAENLLNEVEVQLEDIHTNWLHADFLLVSSNFHRNKQQYQQAYEYAQKCTQFSEHEGLSFAASAGYLYQILNLGDLGKLEQALEIINKIPEDSVFFVGERRKLYLDLAFSLLYRSQNEPQTAVRYAEDAYHVLKNLQGSAYRIDATQRFAELLAQTGQWQKASQIYAEYVALSTRHIQQVQSQYNNVSNLRFTLEQKQNMKERLTLRSQVEEQSNQVQQVKNKWQMILIISITLLLLLMIATVFSFRAKLRQLSSQSQLDPLTGLMNRTAIVEQAHNALSLDQQSHIPFGIAIIDVDHMKRVNDYYGIEAGDRVLKKVASELTTLCQGKGQIGRFSGEEFLLILEDAPQRFCNQLIHHFEQLNFDDQVSGVNLTLSIGVAISSSETASLSTLTKRAEDNLMLAKQRGGNSVVADT